MIRALKQQGYAVFKNLQDLSYQEVNELLATLLKAGYEILKVDDEKK